MKSSFCSSLNYVLVGSFLLLLLLFSHNINAVPSIRLRSNEKVEAVYVFGDSIVDTGNNNYIKTPAHCNFPPYGRDFIGRKPTGRFSNGRVPSDLIAEAFGVKKILPAYLDQSLQLDDLLTGVCFASGGNGYDPITSSLAPAFSLSDQLNQFKEYVEKIKSGVGEERAATIVSKSISVICTGSNDIVNNYFTIPFRSLHYDFNSYADFLVTSALSFIKELHGLGARKFGVLSVPPIGCVPSQRTVRGGLKRECFEEANEAAIVFNSKLSSALFSLNSTLSDSLVVYLDVYYPLLSLIQSPAKYGFEEGNKGCCGTGKIEVTYLCNSFDDPLTCQDDTKFIFWDSFHPTQKAYDTLVTIILNKAANSF
ncbi:GDSL esterase/lipase EXL3-like [Mercurialis annua]|uniref:GDSL esterase/lipase EXL3-like n=1 Tax=Mercurialis annua TaxID=3986 RepID=UPI0021602AF5|nr:GDSL esterase/lipase EXL3-like [Mercurialis annua]